MGSNPFVPEEFGFVLRSDYKPPNSPDYYERSSSDHEIGPDEDWGRINIFLTKDEDFIWIWYGVLDPTMADLLCQKWYGFDWPDSADYSVLFRGYISSKSEAEVILNALRLDRYRLELNYGLIPPDDPSLDNVVITNNVDTRPEVLDLLKRIKRNIEAFIGLKMSANNPWDYEDNFYRFYHQSYKVYALQQGTLKMVEALKSASPSRELNDWFTKIVTEGTGKSFSIEDNNSWMEITRPILEAFLHAKFFIEMAVKYGQELDEPPSQMPDGWAALLYLYNLR